MLRGLRSIKIRILLVIFLLLSGIVSFGSLHSDASTQNSRKLDIHGVHYGYEVGAGTISSSLSSPPINWSSLRGVNYHDEILWTNDADAAPGYPPVPSISFPEMHQLGFNFIRVPIFWGMLSVEGSTYLQEMKNVASEADAEGIAVIFSQFNTACLGAGNTQFFLRHEFPTSIENQFTQMTALFEQYYANNITDPSNGLQVWQDTMQNFWRPVISAVDSYSSVIGYELANEPCAQTVSSLTAYDTYFAEQLRALTGKTIVYGSGGFDTQPGTVNPPLNLENLAQDVHSYDKTSTAPSELANWTSIGKTDGTTIILGEFGTLSSGCETTRYCLDKVYQTYIQAAKANGLPILFWEWVCSNNGNTGLLDANCNADWRVQDLSLYYNSILGPYTNQIDVTNSGSTASTTGSPSNVTSSSGTVSTLEQSSSSSKWISAEIFGLFALSVSILILIIGMNRLRKVGIKNER